MTNGNRSITRRQFLRGGLALAAMSTGLAAPFGSFRPNLGPIPREARASDGYRALVCVFLFGGNDSFNLLVPRSLPEYQTYAKSRRNMAVARDRLLPIQPGTPDGTEYGLHPEAGELKDLFDQGKLALLANVGPLLAPTSKEDYLDRRVPLPPHLFSHSDQQVHWMTSRPDSQERTGWAGRIADVYEETGGPIDLPMNISLRGTNLLQTGNRTVQYIMDADGVKTLIGFADDDLSGIRRRSFEELLEQSNLSGNRLVRKYGSLQKRAMDLGEELAVALEEAPVLQTPFPDGNPLAEQLEMVARMLSIRERLGVRRQIFFVASRGWDTHDQQLIIHPLLLRGLSQALGAFYEALAEIGVENRVAAFTASDFGRTLTSNGDGTDHAWGGNNLVIGGSVAGGDIYGTFPDLTIDGPEDIDFGRLIPTTSVDEYGATLARWFGVSDTDLEYVFPNLNRFEHPDLGFMKANEA